MLHSVRAAEDAQCVSCDCWSQEAIRWPISDNVNTLPSSVHMRLDRLTHLAGSKGMLLSRNWPLVTLELKTK